MGCPQGRYIGITRSAHFLVKTLKNNVIYRIRLTFFLDFASNFAQEHNSSYRIVLGIYFSCGQTMLVCLFLFHQIFFTPVRRVK